MEIGLGMEIEVCFNPGACCQVLNQRTLFLEQLYFEVTSQLQSNKTLIAHAHSTDLLGETYYNLIKSRS